MKITNFVSTSWLILLLAFATSCTDVIKTVVSDNGNFANEPTYCTINAVFGTFHTIEGNAFYTKRTMTGSGLSAALSANQPIRRAEVQVLTSTGTIIQCTETDAAGYFTFEVPDDGETYTIKVLSRSFNAFNKASVLSTPSAGTPYSITTTFVASSNQIVPNLVASGSTADLRGGAFHILDQIYLANDYLLNNTGGAFTVDHKVQAYWAKGINPVTYYGGDPDSGVSFYIPGDDRLFILGGIDGDVTVSDTDHFDYSVIIHEYAHFLEDNYSKSDSPGGAHSGQYVIDPRLAWSEGFSSYFASRVTGDPIYRDTAGYSPTGSYAYYYDMENNQNEDLDPIDMPTAGQVGEGGFREWAISRTLWEATDGLMPFSEFWDIYTDGFQNNQRFREMSLFLRQQRDNGATNIAALLLEDDKEMSASRLHYGVEDNTGTGDVAGNAACRWSIQAGPKLPISGSPYDKSNQFYSNDFFYYFHAGGTLSAEIEYDISGVTTADLDLYVYKDGYTYGVGNDILVYSNDGRGVGVGQENGDESVSISAPAGFYMINVMYYVDSGVCTSPNHATNPGCPLTVYNIRISNNLICR